MKEWYSRSDATAAATPTPNKPTVESRNSKRYGVLSFGARFRSKVLPIGIFSILGLGFSVPLAFMVVSQSGQVLRPNASRLAQSSAVVSGLFSDIHSLATLYEVILTAIFAIGSLIGLIVFLYRTASLTWTALRAK